MECPSYVEYNGYHYLAYSEQGENRVTHYRYKTSLNDPKWEKFEGRDAIDSSGFYAGRLEKVGDKLFAFAWCARLTGGNVGSFDWAGNLVTHELKQLENGELVPVMPYTYKDYFNHEVKYLDTNKKQVTQFNFIADKFASKTLEKRSERVTRLSMKIKINELKGNFGLTFGLDKQYDNRLGDGVIAFNLDNNRLVCYNNVSSILRYGNELTGVNYKFEAGKEYKVDAVMDGEIISVYLNDEVALTSRLVNMKERHFGFYSNLTSVDMNEVRFYE